MMRKLFLLVSVFVLFCAGLGFPEARGQNPLYMDFQIGFETPHINAMVEFLGRCGFSSLQEKVESDKWQIMSDGTTNYFLSEERKNLTLVHLFVRNVDSAVALLEERRIRIFMKTHANGQVRTALVKAPNGIMVGLYPVYDMESGMELYPARKNWTLESILTCDVDPDETIRFWTALGLHSRPDSVHSGTALLLTDGMLTIRANNCESPREPVLVFIVDNLEAERAFLLQQSVDLYQEGRDEVGHLTALFLRMPDGRMMVLRSSSR